MKYRRNFPRLGMAGVEKVAKGEAREGQATAEPSQVSGLHSGDPWFCTQKCGQGLLLAQRPCGGGKAGDRVTKRG